MGDESLLMGFEVCGYGISGHHQWEREHTADPRLIKSPGMGEKTAQT